MILLTPRSTLFPYTTLFRSATHSRTKFEMAGGTFGFKSCGESIRASSKKLFSPFLFTVYSVGMCLPRSEEHTSELQSQFHLVCRLLLEKKKQSYDERNYLRI